MPKRPQLVDELRAKIAGTVPPVQRFVSLNSLIALECVLACNETDARPPAASDTAGTETQFFPLAGDYSGFPRWRQV